MILKYSASCQLVGDQVVVLAGYLASGDVKIVYRGTFPTAESGLTAALDQAVKAMNKAVGSNPFCLSLMAATPNGVFMQKSVPSLIDENGYTKAKARRLLSAATEFGAKEGFNLSTYAMGYASLDESGRVKDYTARFPENRRCNRAVLVALLSRGVDDELPKVGEIGTKFRIYPAVAGVARLIRSSGVTGKNFFILEAERDQSMLVDVKLFNPYDRCLRLTGLESLYQRVAEKTGLSSERVATLAHLFGIGSVEHCTGELFAGVDPAAFRQALAAELNGWVDEIGKGLASLPLSGDYPIFLDGEADRIRGFAQLLGERLKRPVDRVRSQALGARDAGMEALVGGLMMNDDMIWNFPRDEWNPRIGRTGEIPTTTAEGGTGDER